MIPTSVPKYRECNRRTGSRIAQRIVNQDKEVLMLLKDRVALITAGAGAGIGHAVAMRFLEEGANVVVTDAHPRRTPEVAQELSKKVGREVMGVVVDVTHRDQVQRAVK